MKKLLSIAAVAAFIGLSSPAHAVTGLIQAYTDWVRGYAWEWCVAEQLAFWKIMDGQSRSSHWVKAQQDCQDIQHF